MHSVAGMSVYLQILNAFEFVKSYLVYLVVLLMLTTGHIADSNNVYSRVGCDGFAISISGSVRFGFGQKT